MLKWEVDWRGAVHGTGTKGTYLARKTDGGYTMRLLTWSKQRVWIHVAGHSLRDAMAEAELYDMARDNRTGGDDALP